METVGAPSGRVLLAAPRGYCAGVDRAVVTVEKALERYEAPIYVRKQIVHNKHVVEDLERRGAVFVERNLRAIDATCPLVTKVHNEARRFAKDDLDIVLIGHDGHEEVEGTSGEAPEHIQLVQSPADVDNVQVVRA